MDATTTDERSLLERLETRRTELLDEAGPLIDQREVERTEFEAREDATDDDRATFDEAERAFDADLRSRTREIDSLNQRIDQQQLVEARRELAARASRSEGTRTSVTNEPEVYRQDGDSKAPSYFIDLMAKLRPDLRSKLGSKSDGFEERLAKHSKMWEELLPRREAERERKAVRQAEAAELEFRRSFRSHVGVEVRGFDTSPFESRAPSRIPGQGGYFVPPKWLIDEYIPYLRAGRVAAGLCRQMALPPGTDSINIPKLTTPTRTAIQTADNQPIITQDIKDNFVNASVKTVAGFADLPIQLIEQAPGTIIDKVITVDMMADYDQQVDLQVLTGSGVGAPLSGGQIVGIYPASNWSATGVTWTAASPTGGGFFQILGAIVSKTSQIRFNLQDFTFLLHPRRWFWAATYLDSNGRFLVQSEQFPNFNADALEADPTPHEGYAGHVPFGPKVYIDANVPITDSSGTPGGGTADIAIGAIWDDVWLFEGEPRTDVFDQTLSGTLEIRYRLYNYIALLQRYGSSVAIGTGTGFAAPTTVDSTPY
jgi:HK97 family phage major capsid protein